MLAISQDELGGPEVLKATTVPQPDPGVGEILVRVRAAGVNPIDVINRQTGQLVGQPPFILGWDVSGIVEAVGLGVTLYQPGDEVFGLLPFPHGHGAYAEFVVGPARGFVHKPDDLGHVQAAAIPLAGLTGWQALVDTAKLTAGQRVLITAAAGGVGHFAVQIAKARGAHVTGLARPDSADFVASLGADEVIDYTATDFSNAVQDLDVVFDMVGHDYPAKALQVLKSGGTLVSALPQSLPPVLAEAAERGIRAAGLLVESDRLGLTALVELMSAGQLAPTIAATFPLDAVGIAQTEKSGPGKTVLTVS